MSALLSDFYIPQRRPINWYLFFFLIDCRISAVLKGNLIQNSLGIFSMDSGNDIVLQCAMAAKMLLITTFSKFLLSQYQGTSHPVFWFQWFCGSLKFVPPDDPVHTG